MDKVKLIDKLKDKANISYEEAKIVLENNNWDILDSILYLEECGSLEKPDISIYYSNEYKESYVNNGNLININENKKNNKSKNDNSFEGVFEAICKTIDTCNNIFVEIKRKGKVLLKIPLTVLILLLFFAFWIIIPLVIVGLFFDVEYEVLSKSINTAKVNDIFRKLTKNVKVIKSKFKGWVNNG